ncbi:MAG: response regulator [Candidatus Omnitrophica bacterium]|nr:response regulator [Candidatus Omnitrophota bacterium]
MLKRTRVLIVDDEDRFGAMVKINLESTGRYEVRVEPRGRYGVETAKAFAPDLILIDIIMPDITGYEVARALRRENQLKSKPLIFLTALSEEEVSFHEENMQDVIVLTKPISSLDLAARIDQKIKEAEAL